MISQQSFLSLAEVIGVVGLSVRAHGQITLYERTGAIKVQYVDRSVSLLRTGAVGLQMSTESALNVPNSYFENSTATSCPQDVTLLYTPGAGARVRVCMCARVLVCSCVYVCG
jgi:hypothetical protein